MSDFAHYPHLFNTPLAHVLPNNYFVSKLRLSDSIVETSLLPSFPGKRKDNF